MPMHALLKSLLKSIGSGKNPDAGPIRCRNGLFQKRTPRAALPLLASYSLSLPESSRPRILPAGTFDSILRQHGFRVFQVFRESKDVRVRREHGGCKSYEGRTGRCAIRVHVRLTDVNSAFHQPMPCRKPRLFVLQFSLS